MVVSAQTISNSVTSLVKDLTLLCVFCSLFVPPPRTVLLTWYRSQVIHGTHRATRQEYAIKVLDKGHLKRNNKLHTALAEKNTLVRLGSGHPGIVRLHWAFQDDWSLCESPLSLTFSLSNGSRPSRPYSFGYCRRFSITTILASGYLSRRSLPSPTLRAVICSNGVVLFGVVGQQIPDTHALSPA